MFQSYASKICTYVSYQFVKNSSALLLCKINVVNIFHVVDFFNFSLHNKALKF